MKVLKINRLISTLLVSSYCYGEITPPMKSVAEEPRGFTWSSEFLYWTCVEDGLDYAVGGIDPNSTGGILVQGSIHSPEPRWDPGVRVGLGFDTKHDDWNVLFQFTWIENKYNESKAVQYGADNVLTTTWMFDPDDLVQPINHAHARWKIVMNQFDIELGRHYLLSDWFSFMPIIGAKGAWSDQKNEVVYTQGVLSTDVVTQLEMHEYIRGGGIRAGSKMKFHLSKQWSLSGSSAISLLMSRFSNSYRYSLPSSEGNPLLASFAEKIYGLKPVFEINLGFEWETFFDDHQSGLIMKAGWEQQVWMGFNQFFNGPQTANGDLSYQGLILKLAYIF